jgi:hypothetical protein
MHCIRACGRLPLIASFDRVAVIVKAGEMAAAVEGKFMSAFIRAVKPVKGACCAPDCCA